MSQSAEAKRQQEISQILGGKPKPLSSAEIAALTPEQRRARDKQVASLTSQAVLMVMLMLGLILIGIAITVAALSG